MWAWSAGFLLAFMQSPLGVVGTLLMVVIIVVIAHSYIETWTHPERIEILDSDAVPREEHEALKQRVEGLEATLMSPKQREGAVRELSKHSPAGEVMVASDTTVISKDHAEEIRSTLEDAGWNATASYLDKGDAPAPGSHADKSQSSRCRHALASSESLADPSHGLSG